MFVDDGSVAWFKSSYSAAHGECVEVAELGGSSAVRDTRHRELGALTFPGAEWRAFLKSSQTNKRR
nr:DUF397 domain-containing protein [Nocardiopsis sp. TSRI0078]